jgi:hypothetical protein
MPPSRTGVGHSAIWHRSGPTSRTISLYRMSLAASSAMCARC